MDDETVSGFHERLVNLEHQILPSYSGARENDSIREQIYDRLQRLHGFEAENPEIRQFFSLLRANGMYLDLPGLGKPQSTEDINVKRAVVLSQLDSMRKLLAKYDEMLLLVPVLDRLNTSISQLPHGFESEIDMMRVALNKVVSKFNKLSLRSIETVEYVAQCVQRENQNWADVESRLRAIEQRLDVKLAQNSV
ncbi:unnamed protein product [Kuraishia capsulata CBS 1993]|uniref:Uncharacterized protein n=1 Tax=Kuraishia capsulata CBS 1993 TaxID=1382522 RepID=W6MIN0_9ASCO|nr:uncharacterized protein KUCA_T00000192001 [Kuraishia capsulata CBS 1993]CDK24232.1 unnamed protein product [Kuraishia capsulata CBS 1993]